ncbi:hypothetical protein PV326_014085 [Microctonus aethiopoides]|nr:hypothetical protein PV326_014085 [Microctonus aethiopoides]
MKVCDRNKAIVDSPKKRMILEIGGTKGITDGITPRIALTQDFLRSFHQREVVDNYGVGGDGDDDDDANNDDDGDDDDDDNVECGMAKVSGCAW